MNVNYSYNMQSTNDNQSLYAKNGKRIKYQEVLKRKAIRIKQLQKEADRFDREKSAHSKKRANRIKARHAFVTAAAEEDTQFEIDAEMNGCGTFKSVRSNARIFGRLKRKPGHRCGYIDKELMVHLCVMDDDFTEHIRTQYTAEESGLKKPFEELYEDPFQYQGELQPATKKGSQKAEEESHERSSVIPGTIYLDTDGKPIDYFSLVG